LFLSASDTQRFIGYSLWSWELPQDLANAHSGMLAAHGKVAINCKTSNSNFELLDETKDLHASPASIGRIKKYKEHKKHKTPQCADCLKLGGHPSHLLALIALFAHFFSGGSQDERC
jgi:hypothetical protein